MVRQRIEYVYTRENLEQLTNLSKTAISQHIGRGNLDPADLVSIAAFLARYGTEEVRLEIVRRMIGIDRQDAERARRQSTRGVGRDASGRVVDQSPPKRARRKA